MSSTFGEYLKLSIFGQSHGPAIGVVMDGLPGGETIDTEALLAFMDRRRPGKNRFSTQRSETDEPIILSGVYQNKTTLEYKVVDGVNIDSVVIFKTKQQD